jgi:hypothetical protein
MKSVKIERDVTREWLDADIRLCGWCDPRLSREGTQIGKDQDGYETSCMAESNRITLSWQRGGYG